MNLSSSFIYYLNLLFPIDSKIQNLKEENKIGVSYAFGESSCIMQTNGFTLRRSRLPKLSFCWQLGRSLPPLLPIVIAVVVVVDSSPRRRSAEWISNPIAIIVQRARRAVYT